MIMTEASIRTLLMNDVDLTTYFEMVSLKLHYKYKEAR